MGGHGQYDAFVKKQLDNIEQLVTQEEELLEALTEVNKLILKIKNTLQSTYIGSKSHINQIQ